MGQTYRRMEDQKPWRGLARYQDFAEGRKLNLQLQRRKRYRSTNWPVKV